MEYKEVLAKARENIVPSFKVLALGADASMICRSFIISYYGGGREGVNTYIAKLKDELNDTMYMCGRESSRISAGI